MIYARKFGNSLLNRRFKPKKKRYLRQTPNRRNSHWDEKVCDESLEQCERFAAQLYYLNQISISRRIMKK